MTSVFCRCLSAPILALAVSKKLLDRREPVLGGTRYRSHRGTKSLLCLLLALQGMPWVIRLCFCATKLEVLKQEHVAMNFLGVFCISSLLLAPTQRRFLPLVVLQRAAVPRPSPLPTPGWTPEDHQHFLVLLLDILALVPLLLAPHRRERDASILSLLRAWRGGRLPKSSLHPTRSFRSSFFTHSDSCDRCFQRPCCPCVMSWWKMTKASVSSSLRTHSHLPHRRHECSDFPFPERMEPP